MDAEELIAVRTNNHGAVNLLLIHAAEPDAYVIGTRPDGSNVRNYTPLCRMKREMVRVGPGKKFLLYTETERCGRCTTVAETGVPHVKSRDRRVRKRTPAVPRKPNQPKFNLHEIPAGTVTVAADVPFDTDAFYDDVIAFMRRHNINETQMMILAGLRERAMKRGPRPSVAVCAALAVVCDLRLDDYCRSYTGKLINGSRERSSSPR